MRNRQAFHLSVMQGNTDNLQVLCACCHAIKTYQERAEESDDDAGGEKPW